MSSVSQPPPTPAGRPLLQRGLYAITPDTRDTALLMERVRAVLAGRPACVQYRNKQASAPLRRAQAEAVLAECRAHGVAMIVNDDVELAVAIAADGVHVGSDDGDIAQIRQRLGAGQLLGVSCYADLERARAACASGADYVAFGAVQPSATKPAAVRAPLTLFAQARGLGVPLVAIGGITLDHAGALIAAGADMLAVISDVFDAPQPGQRAAAYGACFARAGAGPGGLA